jgi:hypothetical protein
MTVAVCYVSSEGVVFGADSTTTITFLTAASAQPQERHFNFAQKIFEIGHVGSWLGAATWGLGGFATRSYRSLFAALGDAIAGKNLPVADVADAWVQLLGGVYTSELATQLTAAQTLQAKTRTAAEEEELQKHRRTLTAGFFLGGISPPDRVPKAYTIVFDPANTALPKPEPIPMWEPRFAGMPNMIQRVSDGIDPSLKQSILASGKWTGTPVELDALVGAVALVHPRFLPLREVIDWTHGSIYATIKALKFSHLSPTVGGPIELAVLSTDRPFRWVRHKHFDAALASTSAEAL